MQDAMRDDVTELTQSPADAGPSPQTPKPSILPGLLGAGGMLLLVVILLRRLRRRSQARPDEPDLTASERIEAVRRQAALSRDPLERLMAEAEELTRHLAAVLDNKAARLELLIEEADRKLAAFDPGAADGSGPRPDAHDDRRQGRVVTKVGRLDPSLLDRARVAQAEAERASNELRGIDPAAAALRQAASPPAAPPGHERIYRLADEGLSPQEIARRTGEPVGQVELVLNLRR